MVNSISSMDNRPRPCPQCDSILLYNEWDGWVWECLQCDYIEPKEEAEG